MLRQLRQKQLQRCHVRQGQQATLGVVQRPHRPVQPRPQTSLG